MMENNEKRDDKRDIKLDKERLLDSGMTDFNYKEALEKPFLVAFENSAIGMTIVSVTGKWLKVNQEWCDMVGYTEQELLAQTFPQITHPDDLEKNMIFFQKTLNGEVDCFRMEKRFVHKNRSVVWGNLCTSLIRNKDSKPLYFVSQIENITSRKKSEEALRKSEANLKIIFDTTDTSYALFDDHLNITSFNKCYADFLQNEIGFTAKIGDHLSAHFIDEKRIDLSSLFGKGLDRQNINCEVFFPQPNHLTNWYYFHLLPIVGHQNEELGLLIAILNITEKKVDELQKERVTNDLILRNKDLETFAHIMSHDVRSQIVRLIGLTDLLTEYDLNEKEKKETISGISQSARELDEEVKRLNSILKLKK